MATSVAATLHKNNGIRIVHCWWVVMVKLLQNVQRGSTGHPRGGGIKYFFYLNKKYLLNPISVILLEQCHVYLKSTSFGALLFFFAKSWRVECIHRRLQVSDGDLNMEMKEILHISSQI